MFHVKRVEKKKQYEVFLAAAPEFMGGRFLQSYEWGEFLRQAGHPVDRVLIKDGDGKLWGRATLVWTRFFWGARYAYCAFGPELDYKNTSKKNLTFIFKALGQFTRLEGGMFFRFNPPVLKTGDVFSAGELEEVCFWESQAKSRQVEQTLYLELGAGEQELLAQMKSKTRYNIRLARKKGLEVAVGFSKKELGVFLGLAKQTSKRNRFDLHADAYYEKMVQTLGRLGILRIWTASFSGQPIAANLMIYYKDTVTYLHGASSDEHRGLMAPYLLHWQAIKQAREQGFKYYDFWGADEKKWPGVTRFKLGFGGKTQRFAPTLEMDTSGLKYKIYRFSRTVLGK
ncbi:MAG: peptidoglycan bridge formation glycyltransferase FemA/FemB family protein [Patescibacteria group bacterium]|nr:peptidoglycan bridge formation glycyltransferase FemA/FemB family protein [Patescibacteria group bacterium]